MITLGLIPSWQFSPNPAINPMVTLHVSMPPGLPQAGVWSVQPVSTSAPAAPLTGCFPALGRGSTRLPKLGNPRLGYVMVDEGVPYQIDTSGPFSGVGDFSTWSWAYDHRNELALGVGAVLAISLGIALFG
jgi:hypothetical protein